jgi:putative redox protein
MSTKTAIATLAGEGIAFDIRTGSGHTIRVDNLEGGTGPGPAELVGVALAGCSAMDVISILRKKRQVVTRYEVRINALQGDDHPHAFGRIDVLHVVDGPDINPEAVRRAVELSATKYCAVGTTLSSGVSELHHAYLIRDETGGERYGEVMVTGPGRDPGAPAEARQQATQAGGAAVRSEWQRPRDEA